jgi:uncharacterized paraquat-inducible protein A
MSHDRWDELDDEEPFDDDMGDETAEVVECPECGASVYEDAEQCPSCGQYIVHSTSVLTGRSFWTIALFLAGVVAMIAACVIAY